MGTRQQQPRHRRARRRRAFTLVELLVVIGIISVLISMMMPVISQARASAKQTRSCSDLRQMLLGYEMYHADNKGSLLWGFPPDVVNGWQLKVDDPASGMTFGTLIAERYPWRLIGYVSNVWPILHAHDELPPLPTAGDPQAWGKAYTLSVSPTFGINSCFLGGDRNYDGFVNGKPNGGRHCAFKATEIRRPSEQIVFADTQSWTMKAFDGRGHHTLTPPVAKGVKWTVAGERFVIHNDFVGLPKGWFTKLTTTGFFDGHVEALPPSHLADMRLWAPFATTADYDYAAKK